VQEPQASLNYATWRVGIAQPCCASYAVSKALRKYNLAITLALEIIRIYFQRVSLVWCLEVSISAMSKPKCLVS